MIAKPYVLFWLFVRDYLAIKVWNNLQGLFRQILTKKLTSLGADGVLRPVRGDLSYEEDALERPLFCRTL